MSQSGTQLGQLAISPTHPISALQQAEDLFMECLKGKD